MTAREEVRDRSIPGGFSLQVGHTADFTASVLAQARDLLDVVFAGDLNDHDWEHSLGGMHSIVWHNSSVVGHASVIQRRLVHRDHVLRTGYIEGVGVHPDWQRHGIGGEMMAELECIVEAAYDIGALGATDGNLSVHARKLEDGGYIACTKSFEGRLPKTEYKLTAAGKRALESYLSHMETLIHQMRNR